MSDSRLVHTTNFRRLPLNTPRIVVIERGRVIIDKPSTCYDCPGELDQHDVVLLSKWADDGGSVQD